MLRKLINTLSHLQHEYPVYARPPKLIDQLSAEREQRGASSPSVTSPPYRSAQKPSSILTSAFNLFGRDPRQAQWQELAAAPYEPSEAEKRADGHLRFALTMLGVTAVGHAFFPPLVLLNLPATLFMIWNSCHFAYQGWRQKGQITAEFVEVGIGLGILASGIYGLAMGSFAMTSLCRKLLARVEDQSRKSLVNVFGQQPRTVWVLAEGVEVEVPFDQLQVGDTLIVGAGQVIAGDGVVSDGAASVDQHILTGEAKPVEKGKGDPVFAGTFVLMGKLSIQVEQAGTATMAAQIGDILNQTLDYKQQVESRGVAISNTAALPTLAISAVALPLVGVYGAMGVLESSVGYGLRLTGPIGMLNYLSAAAHQGILIKDGRSLELLKTIDTVVFDKTGTLTQEQPQLQAIYTFSQLSEDQLLAYAAAAEARLSHPIAQAIVAAAQARALVLPVSADAHYQVGYGIQVKFADHLLHVGSTRFMTLEGIELPPAAQALQTSSHQAGYSLVMLAVDRQVAGAIVLKPSLRPEINEVVANLHARGLTLYILSGDQEEPTRQLAESLGIHHYQANTLPDQKADFIAALQAGGRHVCFVGDGINDGIALKKANVSISLRGATTVATDTAQIVLMDGTLQQLPLLFRLADAFDDTMQRSKLWAIVPGIFSIAGVFLFHFGFLAAATIYVASLIAGSVNAMQPAPLEPAPATQLTDSDKQPVNGMRPVQLEQVLTKKVDAVQ